MQIFVKSLAGKTFTLDMEPSDTMNALKALIFSVEGLLSEEFSLVMNRDASGCILGGGIATLSEIGIVHGSQLTLAVSCGVDVVDNGRRCHIIGVTYAEMYAVTFDDGVDDNDDDPNSGDYVGENWRHAEVLSLAPRYAKRL